MCNFKEFYHFYNIYNFNDTDESYNIKIDYFNNINVSLFYIDNTAIVVTKCMFVLKVHFEYLKYVL